MNLANTQKMHEAFVTNELEPLECHVIQQNYSLEDLAKGIVRGLLDDIRAGGPGSGRRPYGKKEKDVERQKRALATYVPSNKASQIKAELNEKRLAQVVGGQHLGDHQPFDVVIAKLRIGFEVKTKNEGKKNTITMHPSSLQRKLDAVKSMKLKKVFTVVFDDRVGKIYYAKGVGSFKWRPHTIDNHKSLRVLDKLDDIKDVL